MYTTLNKSELGQFHVLRKKRKKVLSLEAKTCGVQKMFLWFLIEMLY